MWTDGRTNIHNEVNSRFSAVLQTPLKMDLKETEWKGVGWIRVVQNGNSAGCWEHGSELSGSTNAGNFLTS
jgi:hypothetical protein